jgi:tetratricopeptide (TPR) repeat protein
MRLRFCLLTLGLVLAGAFAFAAESAQTLLQQGILAQTGERDFDKAIALYRRALRETDRTQTEIAAQIELQLGLCYETLQKKEDALSAFRSALAFDPNPYGEVHGIAQQRIAQLTPPPASSLSPWLENRRWALSFSGGRSYFKTEHVNMPESQTNVWGSLAYRLDGRLQLGLEGGGWLSADEEVQTTAGRPLPLSEPYQWNRTLRLTASEYYLGGFLQTGFQNGRVDAFLRGGIGAFAQSTTIDDRATIHSLDGSFDDYGFDSSPNESHTDPACALATALQWRLNGWLYVGAGVRGLWVFQKGDYLSNKITSINDPVPIIHYSRYRAVFAIIPFLQLQAAF